MGNCIKNGDHRDDNNPIVLNEDQKKEQDKKLVEFQMNNNPFSKEMEKIAKRQNMGKNTYVKMEMVDNK